MYTTIIEFGRIFGRLDYSRVEDGGYCVLAFSADAGVGENKIILRYTSRQTIDHDTLADSIRGKDIKRVKYESTNGSILVYTNCLKKPYELRFSERGQFTVEYKLEYHS